MLVGKGVGVLVGVGVAVGKGVGVLVGVGVAVGSGVGVLVGVGVGRSIEIKAGEVLARTFSDDSSVAAIDRILVSGPKVIWVGVLVVVRL